MLLVFKELSVAEHKAKEQRPRRPPMTRNMIFAKIVKVAKKKKWVIANQQPRTANTREEGESYFQGYNIIIFNCPIFNKSHK